MLINNCHFMNIVPGVFRFFFSLILASAGHVPSKHQRNLGVINNARKYNVLTNMITINVLPLTSFQHQIAVYSVIYILFAFKRRITDL